MKSTASKVITVFVVVFLAMQLIRFDKTNPVTDKSKELVASVEIKNILKNSCYDCHSNETKWPWYANVAPVSWVVVDHVEDARKWVNFSEWGSYDEAKKLKLRKLIYREVAQAMPLRMYTMAHPNATLKQADKEIIRNWTGIKASDASTRD
jgi:hypothetical protein